MPPQATCPNSCKQIPSLCKISHETKVQCRIQRPHQEQSSNPDTDSSKLLNLAQLPFVNLQSFSINYYEDPPTDLVLKSL